MGKLGITTDVLNQKGSPALYQDLFGNIPAAGYTGRLFVSTDTNNLYRDNGSSWVQVAGSSGGSGVTSITGTANQVIASASTGAITLSLPQNINAGASPTFAGITLSGLSTPGIVINNGSGVLATTTGIGFVKIFGGTISYDNSTYLTTAAASAAYQPIITLTTTGASGAASLASNTLNIPAYTLAGLGGITLSALSASSPLSYNSGTGAFAIQVANTSQAGYLTASDWNTFNAKQTQINGTGFVKASGTTISYDNSTYITLSALSASSPLSYNSGTGAFAIQVANTSQAGYLSQSDWNTFNSKQSTITLTTTGASGAASLASNTLNIPAYTLAGLGGITLSALSASSPLSYNSGTGAFAIQVANTSQAGYLTASDWNNFNTKQSTIAAGTGVTITGGNTINIGQSVVTSASPTFAGMTLTGALSGTSASFSGNGSFGTSYGWSSSQNVIDLNTGGAVYGNTDGATLAANLYYNGTNWKYKTSSYGALWVVNSAGNTILYTVPSGTAGANASLGQVFTISNLGAATFASSIAVNGTGIGVSGAAFTVNGDIVAQRSGGNSGVVYLGASGNAYLYYDGTNSYSLGTAITNGKFTIPSTTASTSYTTGALVVSGGIGIAKDVYTNGRMFLNNAGDLGSAYALNVGGNVSCSGFSGTGATYSNSQALPASGLFFEYSGAGGDTFTLPDPNNNNRMIYIKNKGSGSLTVAAFTGGNILTPLNTSVSTITLLAGAVCLMQSSGNSTQYIQWI